MRTTVIVKGVRPRPHPHGRPLVDKRIWILMIFYYVRRPPPHHNNAPKHGWSGRNRDPDFRPERYHYHHHRRHYHHRHYHHPPVLIRRRRQQQQPPPRFCKKLRDCFLCIVTATYTNTNSTDDGTTHQKTTQLHTRIYM